MRKSIAGGLAAILLATTTAAIADDDWVARSNEHAQVVLELLAEFSPEGAGSLGVDGLDEEISDMTEGSYERSLKASKELLAELKRRREAETHAKVKQDLGILIQAVEDNILSNLSSRVRDMVVEERELAGAMPLSDVKIAGEEVLKNIRALIESNTVRDV